MKHAFPLLLCCLFFLIIACEQGPISAKKLEATKLTFRGDHNMSTERLTTNNIQQSDNGMKAKAGVLTAGEWNDLAHWGFWQQLQQNAEGYQHASYWGIYLNNRYEVKWTDANGQPVMNASVSLFDEGAIHWSTQTNNKGEAVLWFNPYSPILTSTKKLSIQGIYKGHAYTISEVQSYRKGVNELQLSEAATLKSPVTEVLFVVDATGSMGDELSYLNLELKSVVEQYQRTLPHVQLHLGALLYRDHEDDYLMRQSDLTATTADVFEFLLQQNADGGGDFPEAVDVALEAAIEQQTWSAEATTKIIFLLLDAPPRQDEATLKRLKNSVAIAAQKGIQIIPVASSGIDKETEFLMRYIAQLTNGTYTFITDHSGIGNKHIEPTIGNYSVELLNDLLLRLMVERTPSYTSIVQ